MTLLQFETETSSQQPVRLLLVEDDPADASYVERILNEGRRVEFAIQRVSDLSSAKKVAKTGAFDMVILDLNLPDSQGVQTLAQFRSVVGDTVPIVVLEERDQEGRVGLDDSVSDVECLPKMHLDHRVVPRLLYHLLQRQRTENSLHKLIVTNPDGMVVVNTDGVVLFVNPAACELFGRSASQLVGQEFGFPVVGDGAIEIEIAGCRTAEMRVVKINWMEKPAYLTSLRDITERKQMEDDLRHAKVQAELSNTAKTRFLACMSHELRTPLNSVIGFSEMIQRSIIPNNCESCREYAELIHSSGMHLLSIVNDVIDASAIDAGKVKLSCQLFDVNLSIVKSLDMVSHFAQEKEISLSYQPVPYMVPLFADFRRTRQILINLLSNAIRYTPQGGAVTVSCQMGGLEEGISLVVSDTGIGISAENLEKLMQPFSRIGDPYTSRNQGTGLGLYISRVMAELHGGSLSIISELGKGTSVIVRFPADRVVPYRV